MTGEEMERAIQFILQQQAQFWASLQSLEQVVRNHTTQIGEHSAQIAELTARMGGLTTQVAGVTDLVLRLGRIVERQEERMDRADERLNAFIAIVERYISRHNGDR